jgi:hypothetical protein
VPHHLTQLAFQAYLFEGQKVLRDSIILLIHGSLITWFSLQFITDPALFIIGFQDADKK